MKVLGCLLVLCFILPLSDCGDQDHKNKEVATKYGLSSPPSEKAITVDLSEGVTKDSLRVYIGRRIKVIGFWSSRGKQSGYVYAHHGLDGSTIYVKATKDKDLSKQSELENKGKEGARIVVIGILRSSEAPAIKHSSLDISVQNEPSHFYFDVAEAHVAFPDNLP